MCVNIKIYYFTVDDKNTIRVHKTLEICMEKNILNVENVQRIKILLSKIMPRKQQSM